MSEEEYRLEREKDPNMTINGRLDQTQMQLADITIVPEDQVFSTRISTRPIDSREFDELTGNKAQKLQPSDVGLPDAL